MTIKELAKLINKPERTISRWCKEGKIEATHVKGKGKGWDIPYQEAQRIVMSIRGNLPKDMPKEKIKTEPDKLVRYESFVNEADLNAVESKRFLAAMKFLTKQEAELFSKTEAAISKLNDNLEYDERMIDLKKFSDQFRSFLLRMYNNCKSTIDLWQTKYNIPPQQATAMRDDWYKIITDTQKGVLKSVVGSSGIEENIPK